MSEFHEQLALYLDHLSLLRRNHNVIYRSKYFLRDFFDFLHFKKITSFLDVRPSQIDDYRRYRSFKKNQFGEIDSIDTQNRYLGTIKNFFSYLKREGLLVVDPSSDIEYMKVPKRLPKPALTWGEMKKLLGVIDTKTLLGFRNRTILEIFYSSGIRRSELRFLKVEHTDYKEGFLRVIGKGDVERVVPLGVTASHYLENYLKGIRPHLLGHYQSEYVFFGRYGKPFSQPPLDKMLKKYVEMSGLNKKITFHTFRRSCATGMIRNNANVMHVQQILGHTNTDSIKPYIDLTIVDLKKAHQKTHPRELS